MGTLILVAGENGSGKSRCAENIVAQTTGRRYYIATMQPCSEENLRRVEKHRRQRRDLRFTTLELPHRVGAAAVENGSVGTKIAYTGTLRRCFRAAVFLSR